jgi:hypothetical protein
LQTEVAKVKENQEEEMSHKSPREHYMQKLKGGFAISLEGSTATHAYYTKE